jgi:murein DD-endopeptidase MepM/ murein hydrolase activator NlpD
MGAVGRDVRFVETRLAGLRPGRIDGRFDRRLKVAVSRFQRMRRLRADGVVGRKTWRALGVRPARSTPPTSGGDAASNELLGPPLERFPVAGRYQRTRNFGEQRSDHRHEGEDLLSATGTPVVAVDDARIVDVARSGDNGGRGLHVDIRRADGTEFRYYHLSVVAAGVVKGAVVDAGRRLGAVGSTGRSSASHLHFEVHVLREGHRLLVNPAPFLDEVARRNKDAPPETSAPPGPPPPPDAR